MRANQFFKFRHYKFAGLLLVTFSTSLFAGSSDMHTTTNNWSGFYLGGTSGYIRGNANQSISFHNSWLNDGTQDNIFLTQFTDKQLKANGFVGGIQAGYNYQIKHWVPGIVTDFAYIDLSKKYASGVVTNVFSGSSYTVEASYKANWLLTIRPRLGYSFGRLLPYITGGFAVAHEKYSQTITQQNVVFTEKGALSKEEIGWTVGAGTDLALTRCWQLMAEYLYVRLRSASINGVGTIVNYDATHSVQLNAHIVRMGINYTFS